jgi:hypothetical protein
MPSSASAQSRRHRRPRRSSRARHRSRALFEAEQSEIVGRLHSAVEHQGPNPVRGTVRRTWRRDGCRRRSRRSSAGRHRAPPAARRGRARRCWCPRTARDRVTRTCTCRQAPRRRRRARPMPASSPAASSATSSSKSTSQSMAALAPTPRGSNETRSNRLRQLRGNERGDRFEELDTGTTGPARVEHQRTDPRGVDRRRRPGNCDGRWSVASPAHRGRGARSGRRTRVRTSDRPHRHHTCSSRACRHRGLPPSDSSGVHVVGGLRSSSVLGVVGVGIAGFGHGCARRIGHGVGGDRNHIGRRRTRCGDDQERHRKPREPRHAAHGDATAPDRSTPRSPPA